jgi:branched-chain amino acid transport system permease protein
MAVGKSVDGLVMVLLGGIQNLLGPVVGASVFSVLQDYIMRATDYWRALFGGVILVLVLVFPQGIAGFFQEAGGWWRAWRTRANARETSVPRAMEKQA